MVNMSLQCQPRFQNFHEFHWRSTSHHIHQPALRMGSQVTRVQNHKPKWNVMMENPNKWYMKYHEISWNIMKYHEISWNIMKYHEISWNIMKYHEIYWNIMKYHEISWNIMKYMLWMSIYYNSFNDMRGSKVMGVPPNHPSRPWLNRD